jgi:glycosyltransferase involved in cell wall biosynthesis
MGITRRSSWSLSMQKSEKNSIAPFIARVQPILEQATGREGWEIVFVDDGSNDRTQVALFAAQAGEPRVRAIS